MFQTLSQWEGDKEPCSSPTLFIDCTHRPRAWDRVYMLSLLETNRYMYIVDIHVSFSQLYCSHDLSQFYKIFCFHSFIQVSNVSFWLWFDVELHVNLPSVMLRNLGLMSAFTIGLVKNERIQTRTLNSQYISKSTKSPLDPSNLYLQLWVGSQMQGSF